MPLLLGDTAPDFSQDSTQGRIHFHEWLGDSWGILFSHPKDFTPVCTTELGAVARLGPEWALRNTKVLALSVDPLDDHYRWIRDINRTQNAEVDFPLVADTDGRVSGHYGMIHPASDPRLTVRSVVIVDPRKVVRLILTYPPSLGRNFNEILRALDGLQLSDRSRVTTPADWAPGQAVIVAPSVSDDQAARLFPQGWTAPTPYLRFVSLHDAQ